MDKKKKTRELLLIWSFLVPSLAIFILYRVIPLFWNGVLSFQFWSPYKPAEFAGLTHYQEMLFYDDTFWRVLWNTVLLMASAPVGIALALGVPLAYLLAHPRIFIEDIKTTAVLLPCYRVSGKGCISQYLFVNKSFTEHIYHEAGLSISQHHLRVH